VREETSRLPWGGVHSCVLEKDGLHGGGEVLGGGFGNDQEKSSNAEFERGKVDQHQQRTHTGQGGETILKQFKKGESTPGRKRNRKKSKTARYSK